MGLLNRLLPCTISYLNKGFGKYETLGTTTVSLLLIGGAIGIGFHSYYLLLEALVPTIAAMSDGPAKDLIMTLSSSSLAESLSTMHAHEHALDPNAAWFALIGILAKEWLYRITKKVADEERSSVLLANAIHHRSDAYTSVVALFAILGSWYVPEIPLDPIGGAHDFSTCSRIYHLLNRIIQD